MPNILVYLYGWGSGVHVAFACLLFIVVATQETLRLGVFGATGVETSLITSAVLMIAALVLLQNDAKFLFSAPKQSLYGSADALWSLPRSVLGVLAAPLLLVVPLGWSGGGDNPVELAMGWAGDLTPVLIFGAVAQGLFFREAALKAFRGSPARATVASVLAIFVLTMGSGPEAAVLAAGSGLYLMALRLIGCHIVVVSLAHAVLLVAVHDLAPIAPGWDYVILFTVVSATMSLALMNSFRQMRQGVFAYA